MLESISIKKMEIGLLSVGFNEWDDSALIFGRVRLSVKIGDLVMLVEDPNSEWFYQYKDRLFEVEDVFERHCRVRMLNVVNPQRYWFAQKSNFRVVPNEAR
jgi:hypothetical protein